MYRMWLLSILLAIHVNFSKSLSSIPMGIVRDPGLQTQNVQLVMLDGVSHSTSIVFELEKKTIPYKATNVLIGISEMNYDANHFLTPYYEIKQQITIPSITQTGMTVLMTHNVGDLNTVSLSILIISNEYRYGQYMLISKVPYNTSNSYQKIIVTTFLSNTSISVYPFLTGMFIQTNNVNKNLSYAFTFSVYNSSTTVYIYTKINNMHFAQSSNFVNMNILSIKTDMIPATEMSMSWNVIGTTASTTLTMPAIYDRDKSQVFMGMSYFYYRPGTLNQINGLQWKITSTVTSKTFFFDDQFNSGIYFVAVFTSYDCFNPSYPIQAYSSASSKDQCFDQCKDSQWEYYSYDYQDYACASCPRLCDGCYNSYACKKCIVGYVLLSDASCVLNSSYYIVTIVTNTVLCNTTLTGCDTCTSLGQKCLSCKQGYYVASSGFQSYSYYTSAGVLTSTSVLAVSCTICSARITNCLTCNQTVCFTCQAPTQLITPLICQIPIISILPVIYPCTDVQRCKKCLQSALDNCLQCFDRNLTLKNGKCMSPCGDNILLDQQICDDGNNLPSDGCSADCMTVENGWQCQNLPSTRNSYCDFINKIELSLLSITKVLNQNKVIIMLKNQMPYIRDWAMFGGKELKQILSFQVDRFSNKVDNQTYEFKYKVRFTQQSQTTKQRFLQQTTDTFNPQLYKFIQLSIEYNASNPNSESLNHQPITLKFSPALSQMKVFALTPEFSLTFPLYTDQNHMIQFYQPEYYDQYTNIKFGSMIVGILMLIILLIAVTSCLLEGNNSRQILLAVETASVVQFTYFSLIGIGELNPLFIALAEGLKLSCGFDIKLSSLQTQNRILLGVGINSTNILDNINISLILPVIFVLLGVIVLIISKVRTKIQEKKVSQDDQLIEGGQRQQVVNKQKQPKKQCKPYDTSKILLVNLGFGLFLFFLYKYMISIMIQINLGQLQGTSFAAIAIVGLLLLTFLLIMFCKFDLYSKLTEKLSTYLSAKDKLIIQDLEEAEIMQIKRIKKRKIYFVIIILERIINSATLILFFNSSFKINGIIPVLVTFCQLIYIRFFHIEIYNPPNKYRLYFNYFVTLATQILLMIRKLFLLNNEDNLGAYESNYGLYLPFTILILLLIVELNALTFLIYSIKKIRCCELQVQWERIDQALQQEIKQKNVLKQKFNQNLQAAHKISHKLAFQADQLNSKIQIFDGNRNKKLYETAKDLLNKKQNESQNDQERIKYRSEKILIKLHDSENNQIYRQNHTSNNHQSHSIDKDQHEQRQQSEQSQHMKQNQSLLDKKLTNQEIKKQLKYLLKQLKIPQLGSRNKNNLSNQSVRERKKKPSYDYTNKVVYNVYQEYDKI